MPSDYNDTGIATGAIANIQNGADAVPVKSWEIEVEPNLNGKSQIIATQFQGVNFFNEDWEVGGINDTTGLPNSDTNKIRSKTFSRIKGGVTIYINTPQPIRVLFYEADETFISETANIRNNTFTVPSNASLFKIRGTVDYGTTYNDDISINYPSTDTDYHAYVSAPVDNTVNLGRTIYGGSVDVVNGTGTDTHAKMTFTGADAENWYFSTSGSSYRVYAQLTNAKTDTNTFVSNLITPAPSASGYPAIGTGWVNNNGRIVIGVDSSITSVSDWKSYLNNNNMEISYELADEYKTDFTFTPITPTPETALGVNNFYGDTGDSEVTYYKDGYGFTSVTVNQKDSSDTLIDTKTIKLHRLIYEGSVDVIRGIGTISVGESGTEYDPPESFTFPPVSFNTIEGEQFLFASEGNSALTYRKAVD